MATFIPMSSVFLLVTAAAAAANVNTIYADQENSKASIAEYVTSLSM